MLWAQRALPQVAKGQFYKTNSHNSHGYNQIAVFWIGKVLVFDGIREREALCLAPSRMSPSEHYSVRRARICLSWILISTPRGGRMSLPWTMAPRIQMLPGRFVVFSGS